MIVHATIQRDDGSTVDVAAEAHSATEWDTPMPVDENIVLTRLEEFRANEAIYAAILDRMIDAAELRMDAAREFYDNDR